MEEQAMYYITDTNLVYRAKNRSGKITEDQIPTSLTAPTSIAVLDKFLYLTDSVHGLVVLKTANNTLGYNTTAKKMDVGNYTNVRFVTVFRSGAMYYASAMFASIIVIISFMVLWMMNAYKYLKHTYTNKI